MAQKDYVARGQKNKKKPAKKQTKPWLRIVTSFALIVAFAFFLFSLKNEPNPSARKPIVANPDISQSAEQNLASDEFIDADKVDSSSLNKDPLPVLGEEEWAFIDALPAYSVEVDLPEVDETVYTYIMQCGSFRTTERAQELRAQIALQGYESTMIINEGTNGKWHRVVLGPYDRKRAAERERHQLRRANINTCKIYQRS